VLATQPSRGQAIVRHDAFAGMPSMTMAFRVVPAGEARPLRAGDRITAEVNRLSDPWSLSRVSVIPALRGEADVPAIRRVRILREGEAVPDTHFVNQSGAPFSFASLRGRDVVLAFIYTRCQDAHMCPLISAKFAQLQQALAHSDTALVEVTLDPQFDRPLVLGKYGGTFGARLPRWTLATGDAASVLTFDARFGIQPFADPNIGLIHTERTVIVDRAGIIRYLIDDPSWSVRGVLSEVAAIDNRRSNPFARLDLALSRAAVAICGDRVAGFSGLFDLLILGLIVAAFGWGFYRIGRAIMTSVP